jgi:hypothetical protein
VALDHALLLEIDFVADSEAAHDPGNRIPGHFDYAIVFDRRHR